MNMAMHVHYRSITIDTPKYDYEIGGSPTIQLYSHVHANIYSRLGIHSNDVEVSIPLIAKGISISTESDTIRSEIIARRGDSIELLLYYPDNEIIMKWGDSIKLLLSYPDTESYMCNRNARVENITHIPMVKILVLMRWMGCMKIMF